MAQTVKSTIRPRNLDFMQDPSNHFPPPWQGQNDFRCQDLPTKPLTENGLVLVTGASGYIGGRLVPELLHRGYRVRVMVRGDAETYREVWPEAEVVQGDALNIASLNNAMEGVFAAYYLIHSLVLGPKEFAQTALAAARNFRQAADETRMQRIIYLGGLGNTGQCLSSHLDSRHEVAVELARSKIPVTTLRASIIVGSGSASFEIIKNLVKRLRVFPMPKWTTNHSQPIGVRDVIKYLIGVMEAPEAVGKTFDIGGLERLSYARMLEIVSEILQLRCRTFRVPIHGTRLSGYAASLLTPVPAAITQCLFDGLTSDTVCQCDAIREVIPFEPLSYREAIVRALSREEQDMVASRWSDSYPPAHELKVKLKELRRPPRYKAHYELKTNHSPQDVFAAFSTIGGSNGWFTGNWMWRLRGAFDRLIFGVGTARGRRSSKRLRVHDVIDFWRVEDLKTDQRLLLRAEMRMPGRAWLEFTVDPVSEHSDVHLLGITAHYATRSLAGRLYWRFFQPFHWYIFEGLLKQIELRSGI